MTSSLPNALRIALVVHYSPENYGNHLVNFATKRLLETRASSVTLIRFVGLRNELRGASLRRLPIKAWRLLSQHQIGARAISRLRLTISHESRRPSAPESWERNRRFAEFDEKYLQVRDVDVSRRSDLRDSFDLFAVGSDQIWNYDHELGPWLFLDFAPSGTRICIAPSIGHSSIPREWWPEYREGLAGFSELTVRESAGAELLAAFAPGTPVSVLPDPTLMLTRDEWMAISRLPSRSDRYVLVYELGQFSPDERGFVAGLAETHGLSVLWLSGSRPTSEWASNASDFLGFVAQAACVVTDSFHGSVFSFIFDRPLVIVRRGGHASGMNTRIDSLTEQLHLADRLFGEVSYDRALEHDYSVGRAALGALQANFEGFLDRCGLGGPRGTAK